MNDLRQQDFPEMEQQTLAFKTIGDQSKTDPRFMKTKLSS